MRLPFLEGKSPVNITNLGIEEVVPQPSHGLSEVISYYNWLLLLQEFQNIDIPHVMPDKLFAAADAQLVSQALGYKLDIPFSIAEGVTYVQSLARRNGGSVSAIKSLARVRQLHSNVVKLEPGIEALLLRDGTPIMRDITNTKTPTLENFRFLTAFFTVFPGQQARYGFSEAFWQHLLKNSQGWSIRANMSYIKHLTLLAPHVEIPHKQSTIDAALEELEYQPIQEKNHDYLEFASSIAVATATRTEFTQQGIRLEYDNVTSPAKPINEAPPMPRSF